MYLYCVSGTVLSAEDRNERLSSCTKELISCLGQTRKPAAKPCLAAEGRPLCRRQLPHSPGRGQVTEGSPQAALELNAERCEEARWLWDGGGGS